jgi:hypothetical protein
LDLLEEFEKKKKTLPHKVQLVSRTNNRAPCSWGGAAMARKNKRKQMGKCKTW